jgi:hypothetical protein
MAFHRANPWVVKELEKLRGKCCAAVARKLASKLALKYSDGKHAATQSATISK